MTISKKLTLIITCALGMQFVCQAYDAVGLKAEVAQILDFIKELDKQHSAEICTVAGWLDTNIAAEYNSILNNLDIITIAKTATANITLDAKLTVISQIMISKAQQAQQSAEQEVAWAKEHAKQQLEWAEDQAKRDKKAIRAKAEQEKEFLIEEAQKWAQNNFKRGALLGILGTECAIIAVLAIGCAIKNHDIMILEKVADMIAAALERQQSKQTVKK